MASVGSGAQTSGNFLTHPKFCKKEVHHAFWETWVARRTAAAPAGTARRPGQSTAVGDRQSPAAGETALERRDGSWTSTLHQRSEHQRVCAYTPSGVSTLEPGDGQLDLPRGVARCTPGRRFHGWDGAENHFPGAPANRSACPEQVRSGSGIVEGSWCDRCAAD